jgi:phosphoglycolate phosphatase-like HAD superfamily hydrolase
VWSALGRRDEAAVYVGDRHEDRAAAESAGIGFYAVLTGPEVSVGFPGDLAKEAIIASVAELPDKLRA